MLTTEFLPIQGGISTYVLRLSESLPSYNDIIIATPNTITGNDQSTVQSLPDNVKVWPIGKSLGGLVDGMKYRWACKKAIGKIINDFKPDIIHTQSTMPDLLINPCEIGVPIVTTVHSTIKWQNEVIKAYGLGILEITPNERMVARLNPLLEHFEKGYYRKREHFITVSNYCAKRFMENWKKDSRNVQVIPNGVDMVSFNPFLSQNDAYRFKIPNVDVPKVLFLSRLVGIKGINILLDSIEMVNERTRSHLFIAGSGKFEGLDSIKSKNVCNLGYVPHDLAPSLMFQSDIFVMPSYFENCPLTLLEAMASGKAVIAANVGGVPEIIKDGENGLLIGNDAKELADAIVRLVEDPSLRKKIGLAARKTVEESYSWEMSARLTNDCYKIIIS